MTSLATHVKRFGHDDLMAAILATGRFAVLDQYGPVVVLEPRG